MSILFQKLFALSLCLSRYVCGSIYMLCSSRAPALAIKRQQLKASLPAAQRPLVACKVNLSVPETGLTSSSGWSKLFNKLNPMVTGAEVG